mgnify:CR=1 FL=1
MLVDKAMSNRVDLAASDNAKVLQPSRLYVVPEHLAWGGPVE